MKFLALTILAILGSALAAPKGSDELTSSEERIAENFVRNYVSELDRYTKNAMREMAEAICQNKDTDLETPLKEVIELAEGVDVESGTVCSLIKDHLEHVMEPLTKAIDGCLPNEEAGVAAYVVKGVKSIIAHVCESTGEQLLELANPCIDDINLEENKCIENVAEKWNDIRSTTSKKFKDVVCNEYTDIRPCLETAIQGKCKLEMTRNSIMGLMDSFMKTPCTA